MWKRRHIQAYVPSSTLSPADQTKKNEEEEIEQLRKELEFEQKSKDTADWSNEELERSVRAMERNVQALIGGKIWIGTFNLPNYLWEAKMAQGSMFVKMAEQIFKFLVSGLPFDQPWW